jgi:hypothetical protein
MEYHGSHGTCLSHGNSIVNTQSLRSSAGIRGSGGYLWRKSKYYTNLAKSWYQQQNDKGWYSREKEQECAIVLADLACEADEILDLSDPDLKEKITDIVDRLVGPGNSNVKSIAKGYDQAIQAHENESQKKIKLLVVDCQGPRQEYCGYYNWTSLGPPPGLIIRDNSIIKSVKIMEETEVQAL